MPWIVGIDEAGYGPNLGPFVMSAVACWVADDLAESDFWQVLHSWVRRHGTKDDGRLMIDDSKLVHANGLGVLEVNVLAAFNGTTKTGCVADYLDRLCPDSHGEVRGEPWYTGQTSLPVEADPAQCASAARRFTKHNILTWSAPRSVVICTERFNELLHRRGSKGAVLAHALSDLVEFSLASCPGAEPIYFFVDKHGGRNFYGPMLQERLCDANVFAIQESSCRSVYRVLGLARDVRLTFEPRADSSHLCVALASMVSKYVRELLMVEFNRFWQRHIPELKPTAGYPGDSRRFFKSIRHVARELGIAEQALWRKR